MATLESKAARLRDTLAGADAKTVLHKALVEQAAGRAAVVTSFGAEAAPLLHLVSKVNRHAPVLFVDTGKHFGETKRYGRDLTDLLGLTDVPFLTEDSDTVKNADPDGLLFSTDPDRCCAIRKISPLQTALRNFDSWVTGRKRYQASTRANLGEVDADETHIKFNPIIDWSRDDVQAYFEDHDLPRHPLEADGFLSIGCMTCTDRVRPGEDPRAGRWRGAAKVECGIHQIDPVQLKRQGGTHAVVR